MYTKTKLNLIFNRHCSWTRHCEIDVFGNLPSFFSNWPNFLDVLAGNFFGTWQHWACTTHRDRHTTHQLPCLPEDLICSMPAGPVRQGEPAPIGRLSLSFAYRRRKKWCQYAIQLRGMTSCRHGSRNTTTHRQHCCQVSASKWQYPKLVVQKKT